MGFYVFHAHVGFCDKAVYQFHVGVIADGWLVLFGLDIKIKFVAFDGVAADDLVGVNLGGYEAFDLSAAHGELD